MLGSFRAKEKNVKSHHYRQISRIYCGGGRLENGTEEIWLVLITTRYGRLFWGERFVNNRKIWQNKEWFKSGKRALNKYTSRSGSLKRGWTLVNECCIHIKWVKRAPAQLWVSNALNSPQRLESDIQTSSRDFFFCNFYLHYNFMRSALS